VFTYPCRPTPATAPDLLIRDPRDQPGISAGRAYAAGDGLGVSVTVAAGGHASSASGFPEDVVVTDAAPPTPQFARDGD